MTKDSRPLPRTHDEIFERTLDRQGRPAGREPLPRSLADVHGRALDRRGRR